MTLPASGVIYLSQVDTELGRAASAQIDMNESAVRTLFGVPSGTIYMSNGYGKSAGGGGGTVTITVVSSIKNFNVWNNRLASQHGGAVTVSGTYASNSTVNVVVNSGVVIGSTSASSYAFDTGAGWSGSNTLTLTNNGYITGRGGDRGRGGSGTSSGANITGGNGGGGGPAMYLQRAISITNASGYIYSGGGGGGGAAGGWNHGYSGGGGGGSSHPVATTYWNHGNNYTRGGDALLNGPIYGPGGALNVNGGAGVVSIGGGGGGGGASGGIGGVGTGNFGSGFYGHGGGHGKAIQGIGYVTWLSGNTRVYGGTA